MVAVRLEDVELGVRAHVDDGEAQPLLLVVNRDRGLEDLRVERVQSIGVAGEDRDVVEAAEQHGRRLMLPNPTG